MKSLTLALFCDKFLNLSFIGNCTLLHKSDFNNVYYDRKLNGGAEYSFINVSNRNDVLTHVQSELNVFFSVFYGITINQLA